jgi:hypothetical protein
LCRRFDLPSSPIPVSDWLAITRLCYDDFSNSIKKTSPRR